jgi:iron complex outermembrane receptor protein
MLQTLSRLTSSVADSGVIVMPTRDKGEPMNKITLKTEGVRPAWQCLSGVIGSALLTIAFVPTTTVAQDQAEADVVIDEVVVTAARREQNLQDVPIAVSAITGDDLALRGAQDITDLAETIPSLTLEPSRATSTTLTAFIRGVGQQDPLAGFEPGVALYLDDVYLARPQGALLDIYDVERIEVLRGPQGTLYGRNAVGGAIKYVTRRLSDDPSLRLRGVLGSYGQMDLVATGSAPLSDTFKIGGTVASFTRDGFGDNLTTGEENYNKDVFAYRVSGEFAPNDNFLIKFGYDHSQDDTDPVIGHRIRPGVTDPVADPVLSDIYDTTGGASQAPSTASLNGNNEQEVEGYHVSIDWMLNSNWTVRSITANRDDYTETVIDFDGLPTMDFDAIVIYDNEQFSQELQLLYTSDRLNMVAGLYYLDASAVNHFDIVLFNSLTQYTGGYVDTEATSAFVDVTYDISDRLALSVGGRYTSDKRSADIERTIYVGIGSPFFGNDSPPPPVFTVQSDYTASRTYDDFSPRINLSYAYDEDTILYGGITQGYKAGSYDPRGANLVSPAAERGFEPETVDSYEFGMKRTWAGGRARTNIALFFSDYKDVQIPGSVIYDSDGDGVNDSFAGAVTNAGKAEIKGIEFEGLFALTDNLTASAAFSLLDAEYKEFIVNDVDVADERTIQNTPEKMVSVNLNYDQDLANGTLNLGLNWSYKDDIVQFEFYAPDIDQKAYSLFNASATWTSDDDRWLVGVYGKNLGDEEIKTAGYCFGLTGCPSALGAEDNTTLFYAPPRTVSAAVEYRF